MNETAIAHALREAGATLPPLTKRIWTLIHDAGPTGLTVKALAARMNLNTKQVSGTISQMETRGMIDSRKEPQKRGVPGRHVVKWYTTRLKEYELLPLPRKPAAAEKPTVTATCKPAAHGPFVAGMPPPLPYRPEPVGPTLVGTPQLRPAPIDVDSLPLAEARRLYIELRSRFTVAEVQ